MHLYNLSLSKIYLLIILPFRNNKSEEGNVRRESQTTLQLKEES